MTEDADYVLMSVVLFKRVADDFKTAARLKGFQARRGWLTGGEGAWSLGWGRPVARVCGARALGSGVPVNGVLDWLGRTDQSCSASRAHPPPRPHLGPSQPVSPRLARTKSHPYPPPSSPPRSALPRPARHPPRPPAPRPPQVKEYVPPPPEAADVAVPANMSVEQLRAEAEKKRGGLENWCRTAYGEVGVDGGVGGQARGGRARRGVGARPRRSRSGLLRSAGARPGPLVGRSQSAARQHRLPAYCPPSLLGWGADAAPLRHA